MRALLITRGLVNIIHRHKFLLIIVGFTFTLLSIFQWWRDITREASLQGHHTLIVKIGIKWGVALFIVSEILFFFSFFWAFFHARLSPDIELGMVWPPTGVVGFNPYHVPLLNTTILLSSGVTVTWAHHRILEKQYTKSLVALRLTVLLGIYFRALQALEYLEASFRISDRIFGTTFFVATGFHGLHVLIGTTFLRVNIIRISLGHLSKTHHFRFEAAAWYWHFVDVVWLFLYTFVYWWCF